MSGHRIAHGATLGILMTALGGCAEEVETWPSQSCTPGTTQSCVGANDCAGEQVCRADGSGFDPCECGAGGSGGAVGGAGGAVGGAGGAVGGAGGAVGGAGGAVGGAGGAVGGMGGAVGGMGGAVGGAGGDVGGAGGASGGAGGAGATGGTGGFGGTGATGGMGGTGGSHGCDEPSDCGVDTSCRYWTCESNTCHENFQAWGVVLPPNEQVAGNCVVAWCNGMGGVINAVDNSDIPADDGNDCTGETCNNGTPEHPDLTIDTPCTNGGGEVCDGNGACVECNGASQCPDPGECGEATCDGNACGGLAYVGDPCASATDQCNDGICDDHFVCVPHVKPGNPSCDDYDSCTDGDVCGGGVCSGTATTTCLFYLEQHFEACPMAGWTLNPDWECGAPTSGPNGCHDGDSCLATNLEGDYGLDRTWDGAYAETPVIDLTSATEPALAFWAWWDTEGSTYDGFHVEVSTDGGTSFALLTPMVPSYNLTVGGEPAWGGRAGTSWRLVTSDLSPFVGSSIVLRFAFRSDDMISYDGVYLDQVQVSEASAVPLYITTGSPLPLGVVGAPYATTLARIGGSSGAEWSITGGTNAGWLSIDPVTGELSGTPAAGNVGPVSVNVRVYEPANPGNFDAATLTFDVVDAVYFEGFEGACPNGWTLAGDWECGAPAVVGPASAYSGTQCIATQIDANYSPSQPWATTTATSPSISLAGTVAPSLLWRVWMHTETTTYDGYNLKISTDGGGSWQTVTTVSPVYETANLVGEHAWGGNDASLGWQEYSADLSAFAGQSVQLRFAFRSDNTLQYAGVYIDDVLVTD